MSADRSYDPGPWLGAACQALGLDCTDATMAGSVVQGGATLLAVLVGFAPVAWNQIGAAAERLRARRSAREALVNELKLEIDNLEKLAVQFVENGQRRVDRGEAFLFANNPAPSNVFELQGPILATLPLEEAVAVAAYRRSFGTLNALLDTMETPTFTGFPPARRLIYLNWAKQQVKETLQNALELQFRLSPARSAVRWANRWRRLTLNERIADDLSRRAACKRIVRLLREQREERAERLGKSASAIGATQGKPIHQSDDRKDAAAHVTISVRGSDTP